MRIDPDFDTAPANTKGTARSEETNAQQPEATCRPLASNVPHDTSICWQGTDRPPQTLANPPQSRLEKVAALRRAVVRGEYEDEDKLNAAIERLWAELAQET